MKNMRSYWLWLLLLFSAWFLAASFRFHPIIEHPLILIGSALFFALYFLTALMQQKPNIHMLTLTIISLISIVMFWPTKDNELALLPLLVYAILAGNAVHRLHASHAIIVSSLLFLVALSPYLKGYPIEVPIYISFSTLLLTFALCAYYQTKKQEALVSIQHEVLRTEFRKVKRQLLSSEKFARQDERAQIARDMHDSVGHRLTALLMQLEIAQMQEKDRESKERLLVLKDLAKASLADTRSAVKTLKNEDIGGLSAIISLIRKLEAESHVRIEFSIKHGALSAPLTNEQSIVIYRSVQEALTNMMRHSQTKEATIIFDVPASKFFRFEITNPISEKKTMQEGFGLTSMRERINQVNGTLEIQQYNALFSVKGRIPLMEGELEA
ncbi:MULTISPECIES: sensor histidine kinase [Paraliobacillus]|uniref:sensor histidine kinase n=1 Tax=Paraliobacillus TaxID=200903 RepID=UPI001E52FA2D|nr:MULTISPECIES: histidine kinase [Paraliobacillus]